MYLGIKNKWQGFLGIILPKICTNLCLSKLNRIRYHFILVEIVFNTKVHILYLT